MPAVAAFSVMDSKQNNSGNSDKINSNDARINELGIEFTTRGKVIDRNKNFKKQLKNAKKNTLKKQKLSNKKIKKLKRKKLNNRKNLQNSLVL